MESIPSASYSVTLRIEFPHEAGSLGRILTTVGDAGGMVGAVDIVRVGEKRSTRDITVNARDSEHGERVVKAVEELPGSGSSTSPTGPSWSISGARSRSSLERVAEALAG